MSKHWEFKYSPIPDGKPKTLADVPEGVWCVVETPVDDWVFRKRTGDYGCGRDGYPRYAASKYKFVSYIDGLRPPEQPKQWTFADVPVGRCFRLKGDEARRVYWISETPLAMKIKAVDGTTANAEPFNDTSPVTLIPLIAELVADPAGDVE